MNRVARHKGRLPRNAQQRKIMAHTASSRWSRRVSRGFMKTGSTKGLCKIAVPARMYHAAGQASVSSCACLTGPATRSLVSFNQGHRDTYGQRTQQVVLKASG
jgi:hypothetical protein